MSESIYALADRDARYEYKTLRDATAVPPEQAGTCTAQQLQDSQRMKGMYQSIHPKVYSTVTKRAHGTMGPAKVSPPDPTDWTKAHSGHPPLPEPKEFHYDDPLPRKPPVPGPDERPIMALPSKKDFIQSHIVDMTLAVPPPTEKEDINWCERPGFGKRPKYLDRIREDIAREQATLQAMESEYQGVRGHLAYQLDPAEKAELLEGLKRNWKALNEEYTTQMKVMQETYGQKNRKMWLEQRMADLENDIAIMERELVFVEEDRM